jgi:hypothetical protein
LVKWPGKEEHSNFLYLHRDWMYIDESGGDRTYVAFVALEEITDANGAVHVLPRGNDLDRMLRGTGMVAPWLRHGDVIRPRMRALDLGPGDAAVWDGAIVHSPGPNLTDTPRVAVGIWLRPTGRQLLHYRRVSDTEAVRHLVEPRFFLTASSHTIEDDLSDDAEIERRPIAEVDLSAEELDAALDALGAPSAPGSS